MHAGSNTSYGRKWSSGNTVGCLIDVSPGYPSGSHASIRSLLCVHALTDGTLECFWLYLSTRLLVVAVCRSRWKAETSDALSPSPWPTARLVVISDHSLNQHPHHTAHLAHLDRPSPLIYTRSSSSRSPGCVPQSVRTVPLSGTLPSDPRTCGFCPVATKPGGRSCNVCTIWRKYAVLPN